MLDGSTHILGDISTADDPALNNSRNPIADCKVTVDCYRAFFFAPEGPKGFGRGLFFSTKDRRPCANIPAGSSQTLAFVEEWIALLECHGVQYDERYITTSHPCVPEFRPFGA